MKINEKGNIEMTPEEFEELFNFYDTKRFERGSHKWIDKSVTQNKCMRCNNYHGVNMPCPHMMTWS